MEKQTSNLWMGITIGALAMLFIVNFLSNNFFYNVMSPSTCAMMHGPSSYFHHSGFWITLVILIIVIILVMQHTNKRR